MKTIKAPNRLSFYGSVFVLVPFFIICLFGFGAVSVAHTIYHDVQYDTINFGTNDMCKQKAIADLALRHGLNYETLHFDDTPNIKVTGKSQLISQIREEYDKLYPEQTGEIAYAKTEPPRQCHLPNVKLNVENINTKLLPYIPNDVDYVSYSPTKDKAVYCYYYFRGTTSNDKNSKIGSQCAFIQLNKNIYGKDEFENYDISDMERTNLDRLSEFWNNKQQPSSYYGLYSYVTKWEDSPTHYFGFNLATPYSGNRWGAYGEY